MKNFGKVFLLSVAEGMNNTGCSAGGKKLPVGDGITAFYEAVVKCAANSGKVIYIGNGGSASIAGHMAADLWKNGGVKAMCFTDPALLTCLANDLGYENIYSVPTESFAEKGDVFVAISSSGKSPNILKAAGAALKKGCVLVTLSGFGPDNPLRSMGAINFYVPSQVYGVVETVHSALCHSVVDYIIQSNKQRHG
ncbi:MAG: SIS domain-containing protein [Elusimicrobiales bacterium]